MDDVTEGQEPNHPAPDQLPRRVLFHIAAMTLRLSVGEAATRLGVTYTHLTLVLDGHRTGSRRLEDGIRAILDEARPVLLAALRVETRSDGR